MNQRSTLCPAHRAIELLQEKWVMFIVQTLLSGDCGFNELSRLVGGCNSATLTQRLENLETLGIISKTVDTGASAKLARSIYSLTPAGRELESVIDAINAWGLAHLPENSPSSDAALLEVQPTPETLETLSPC